ncbi:DNA glycosylase [Umbelopsis sp. PMI_123]|nr:DNA glycosylase [Umbelopsis sp. PMI_123]
MAGRRQSSRLSKQALNTVSESKLKVKRELFSKYAYDGNQVNSASGTIESKKALKPSRPKGAKASKSAKPGVPPDNWKSVYEAIKEYRKVTVAPVDTMGCERLAEETVDEKTSRYQTLTSLMLSSQTKDAITAAAMQNLQTRVPGGLTLDNVIACDKDLIHDCIKSVGFHTRKTDYIKATALILKEKYNGDIPDTIEGLTSLPGVGPKMGYLTLQCAWNKNTGIGVDVHVHRISNRLGWVKTDKGSPEDTRKALESWLPKECWKEVNPLFVGFGQVTCLPRGPLCNACPVSDLCPSAKISRAISKRRYSIALQETLNDERNATKKVVKQEESVADTLSW